MKIIFIISFLIFTLAERTFAKVKVVATTADIAALVKQVGGDLVEVTSIAKGSQNPHYIEAKPSYMVQMRDAALLVSNGLSLEVGWLPNLIQGARNPKINPGSKGYLELGSLITPDDIPTGKITRAMGDVHPEGNPHFMLAPLIVAELSEKLALKLAEIDGANQDIYLSQAKSYQKELGIKVKDWRSRVEKSGVKSVVTYHPSLLYFLKTFGLSSPINLESKPGISPSAQHILKVVDIMKKQTIRHIWVDSFFDTKIADRVAKEVPGAKVYHVGISVDSLPELNNLEDVTEQLIKTLEAK